jgi:hypothetical protein
MAAMSQSSGGLRARWEGLSDRERLMVGGLLAVAVTILLLSTGLVARRRLVELRDDNADVRRVLKELEQNKENYQRLKAKSAQVESRLGHGGMQLEGLLEAAANASNVEISETNERPATPVANKKYIERSVEIRVRKVTLEKLAHFLRRIETGAALVVVTSLTARARDDKHEDLEVEMTVTTWEKAPDAKKGAGGGAGKDAPKGEH